MKRKHMFSRKAKSQEELILDLQAVDLHFKPLLEQFTLDIKTYLAYKKLTRTVFGTGPAKAFFVTIDPANKNHKEYNRLSLLVTPLHAHLVANRKGTLEAQFIQLFF